MSDDSQADANITAGMLQYYDEQIRRLAVGSGHYEAVPDPPYPSMAAEHMRQSREMSERIGVEFHRIIERAGERYGRLPVELFARITGGEFVPESELREIFGIEPPRRGVTGGNRVSGFGVDNVIIDDLEKENDARYRMKDRLCAKCLEKKEDKDARFFYFTSRTPYCHKCLDSSKERIVSDWCKRHEYLPKVREMRRRGADTEEWLLFIRSKKWQ